VDLDVCAGVEADTDGVADDVTVERLASACFLVFFSVLLWLWRGCPRGAEAGRSLGDVSVVLKGSPLRILFVAAVANVFILGAAAAATAAAAAAGDEEDPGEMGGAA
jgi:hypothetical protein